MFSLTIRLSIILTSLLALVFCAALLAADGSNAALFLFASGAAAGLIFPRLSIGVFLMLLPVFGNRPGSPQTYWLTALGLGLNLGVAATFLQGHRRIIYSEMWRRPHPVLFFSAVYLIVSLLSLAILPLRDAVSAFASSLPSKADGSAAAYVLLQLFTATEEKEVYPLLSCMQTMLAVNMGVFIFVLTKESQQWLKRYGVFIFSGLLCSLAAGLLDYYELIDLRSLRALDPVANIGNYQFRIQSFFGHSGWFAEYITLTIPYAMVLLLLPLKFGWRILLLIGVMIAGEFVLILSYQRGGWLSYPLTLVVIWAAIYITRQIEKGDSNFGAALRRSTWKVALSLPLTIAASLALVSLFSSYKGNVSLGEYFARAKQIGQTSDRTDFMKAAFAVGFLHPVLGAGAESFAVQYEKEFGAPEGRFYGLINLPLHGSAHNVYFQTFAGKGAAGLIALLLLLLIPLVSFTKLVFGRRTIRYEDKLLLLMSSAAICAFLIYGNVQEVFYVQSLQYLLFGALFIGAGVSREHLRLAKSTPRSFSKLLLFALAAHLVWEIAYPGHAWARRSQTFGCFRAETAADGSAFRWCGTRATQIFPVVFENGQDAVKFKLRMGSGPASTLQVRYGSTVLREMEVHPGAEHTITIPVSEIPGQPSAKRIPLTLRTASYFIPARDRSGSDDRRVLSYQLLD